MPERQSLSQRIAASRSKPIRLDPHLVINAYAGVGKSSTLTEGVKAMRGVAPAFTPSSQQEKIWEELARSKDAGSVVFLSFNKAIATELQKKIPAGCQAMTMHSLGYKAVTRSHPGVKMDQYRVSTILAKLLNRTEPRDLRKERPGLVGAVETLVALCKVNLVSEPDEETLEALAAEYDVDLDDGDGGDLSGAVFPLVGKVMERCLDVASDGLMDFNDMVWLPVALDLPLFRHDLLLCDESQDLSKCQQQLALRSGHRIVCVGDRNQALYHFAGADHTSMDTMRGELADSARNVIDLPLTVTRRCGKAIVERARKIVPDFEAHPDNPEGKVLAESMAGYRKVAAAGDMVLCRTNAPLVAECFGFLRDRRKATIAGRDVGSGLVRLVRKLGGTDSASAVELVRRLDEWRHRETDKEEAKKRPSDARIAAVSDKYHCLLCFCENAATVGEVVDAVSEVFNDENQGDGVRLSTVHKAKGLEASRVFLLLPKESPIPHPMARTPAARAGERCVMYVAVTRAINELYTVTD